MKNGVWRAFAVAAATLIGAASAAQQVAEVGFSSVGRGAPLVADLNEYHMPGPTTRMNFDPDDPRLDPTGFVGAAR